jgi:membrane-bound serine protease (ClpP class)
MDPIWLIVIYVAGLAAMLAELFLPGAVMGIVGFIAVCGTIIGAYATGHPVLGTVMVGVTIAMFPLFFLIWRRVLGRFWALKSTVSGTTAGDVRAEVLLGKEGDAVSQLHPSGIAAVEGMRYSVVTRGEMLEKGARVKVIEVTGSRIVVKKA